MRRIPNRAGRRSLSRRIRRRRPLHVERLEQRSMFTADVGVIDDGFEVDPPFEAAGPAVDADASPADQASVAVACEFVCVMPDIPGDCVPEMPGADPVCEPPEACELDGGCGEEKDYLEAFNTFLAANPDWLAKHDADGMQLCVMAPSQFVAGLELADPGVARAFDAWFEQEQRCSFVAPITTDESMLGGGAIPAEDPVATDDMVDFDPTAPEFSGGGPVISFSLLLISSNLQVNVFRPLTYGSWNLSGDPLVPIASGPVGGVNSGNTSGPTLTGTVHFDGDMMSWLSLVPRRADCEVVMLTVSGAGIVQRSVDVPALAVPHSVKQPGFAQVAASFMAGSSYGSEMAAEQRPSGGGRRKARG